MMVKIIFCNKFAALFIYTLRKRVKTLAYSGVHAVAQTAKASKIWFNNKRRTRMVSRTSYMQDEILITLRIMKIYLRHFDTCAIT